VTAVAARWCSDSRQGLAPKASALLPCRSDRDREPLGLE
jgi:hypothetical protein